MGTMESAVFCERYTARSAHQRDILLLRCQGMTNQGVVQRLFVTERTIRNQMTRILAQMGLRGRRGSAVACSQLRAYEAAQCGLVMR